MMLICCDCPRATPAMFVGKPPRFTCPISGETYSPNHVCDQIPQTMKQIRTICRDRACAAEFDALVNQALKEGWTLTGKCVYPVLGAFLEREEEVTHD